MVKFVIFIEENKFDFWTQKYFYRYYADLEKKRCPDVTTTVSTLNSTADPNACIVWRRFAK